MDGSQSSPPAKPIWLGPVKVGPGGTAATDDPPARVRARVATNRNADRRGRLRGTGPPDCQGIGSCMSRRVRVVARPGDDKGGLHPADLLRFAPLHRAVAGGAVPASLDW